MHKNYIVINIGYFILYIVVILYIYVLRVEYFIEILLSFLYIHQVVTHLFLHQNG